MRDAHDGVAYGLKDNWNKRATTTSTTDGCHEAVYSLSDNQHNTVVPAFVTALATQDSTVLYGYLFTTELRHTCTPKYF